MAHTDFTVKINKRTVGTEQAIGYGDPLYLPEEHIITLITIDTLTLGQIKLSEVALQEEPSTVYITVDGGLLREEITNGSILPTQYKVDYTAGYVSFNSADIGLLATVKYYGRGSIVDAIDVNGVQTATNDVEDEISAARGIKVNLDTRITTSLDTSGNISATGTVNFNHVPAQHFVVELNAGDPTSPTRGQIWYNEADDQYCGWSGSAKIILG